MNDQVDRYRLIKRIGKGGMAEVFLASADGPHGFSKRVAIKKILPQHSKSNADFERRFIREANIAVELEHANIVQVLDFGATEGTLYIVMEFVEGSDLRTLLASRRKSVSGDTGALSLLSVVQIAIELCNGLSFAHKRGIVHRDISPANILLSRDGAVKVADFGIAKAMDSFKTDVGLIVGKWRYMSPEQARGELLDHRSDLFSFGIVLFELLTGNVLFDGKSTEDIVRQISGMPTPEVPIQFERIIRRCLSRQIDGRYQDAKEIIVDLRTICLQEQWLPSSDDVAKVVGIQAKSTLDKTKPLFAIDEPCTEPMNIGIAAEMRRLGVDDSLPSRITQLDGAEAGEGTSTTVMLKPRHIGSGLPTWKAETVVRSETIVETEMAPYVGTEVQPEHRSESSVGVPDSPQLRRKQGMIFLFIAIAMGLGVVYVVSGPGSDAEVATIDPHDAGAAPSRDSQFPIDTATLRPPADAQSTEERVVDASLAFDARPSLLGRTPPTRRPAPASNIAIWVDPWADVYFRGRKIGRAPKKNFRLPHGRHKLRLVNPSLGVEKTVTVTVPASKPYRFQLGP